MDKSFTKPQLRQLIDVVTDIVQQSENRLRSEMNSEVSGLHAKMDDIATKADLEKLGDRLERKIAASHTTNFKHHLETLSMIGTLNNQFTTLREGLAQAAR